MQCRRKSLSKQISHANLSSLILGNGHLPGIKSHDNSNLKSHDNSILESHDNSNLKSHDNSNLKGYLQFFSFSMKWPIHDS